MKPRVDFIHLTVKMIKLVVALWLLSIVNFGDAKDDCSRYLESFVGMLKCEYVAVNLNFPDRNLPKLFAINITLENDSRISLNLKSTDNFLVNENTTVMFNKKRKDLPISVDYRKNFKKRKILTMAENLRGFELYHDKDQLASMMIYKNPKGKLVMEGAVDNNLLWYLEENDEYIFVTTTRTSIKTYTDRDSTLWKLPVSYSKPDDDHIRVFKVIVVNNMSPIAYEWVLRDLLLYFNAVSLAFSQFQSQRIQLQIVAIIFRKHKITSDGAILKAIDSNFISRFLLGYQGLDYDAFIGMNHKETVLDFAKDTRVLHKLNCNHEQKRVSKAVVTFPHNFYSSGFNELARELSYLLPDPKVDPSGMFMECLSMIPTLSINSTISTEPTLSMNPTAVNEIRQKILSTEPATSTEPTLSMNSTAVNEIRQKILSSGMITIIVLSCISALAVTLLVLYYYVPKFRNLETKPDDSQPA